MLFFSCHEHCLQTIESCAKHLWHQNSLHASVLENHFCISGFKRWAIRETSDERRDEKFASWSMEGEKIVKWSVCSCAPRATRARIYGEAICIEKSPALIAPFVCSGTLALESFACNSPCVRSEREKNPFDGNKCGLSENREVKMKREAKGWETLCAWMARNLPISGLVSSWPRLSKNCNRRSKEI